MADDASVAEVKALLRAKLSERQLMIFRDEDYNRLASAGFWNLESFEAATSELLMVALPGRSGLVAVLLKAFAPVQVVRNEPGGDFSETLLWKTWEECKEELTRALRNFQTEKASYENRFPSSVGPICGRGDGVPCLLYHGMGTGLVRVDERLKERLEGTAKQVTVILSPSGSGKTRNLIELACKRECMFFVGSKAELGPAPGSNDLAHLRSWLERLFPADEKILQEALTFGVGMLVLIRLLVWRFLKQYKPDLCPREWLFFQLEVSERADIFESILHVRLTPSEGCYGSALRSLRLIVSEKAEELEWHGFTVLDEAQVINGWFQDSFPSTIAGVKRSVLNPLILRLLGDFPSVGSSIFVSGTGRSMMEVANGLRSGSMKPYNILEVQRLQGFETRMQMIEYAQQIVDVSRLDMEGIFGIYKGRRRWFVTALERYLAISHSQGTETDQVVNRTQDAAFTQG